MHLNSSPLSDNEHKQHLRQKYTTTFEDTFSEEVWRSTYKDHTDVDVNDTMFRVAQAVASIEATPESQHEWTEKFYDLLSGFKATAGGRIYANAGTKWGGTTLMNCFAPDVEVLTSIGRKKICDIEIGDHVLTHTGKFKPVIHTMMRQYVGPVQRFRSAMCTADIISTPEHPYYQGAGKWVRSEDTHNVSLAFRTNDKYPNITLDLADLLPTQIYMGYVEVNDTTVNTINRFIGGQGASGIKRGAPVNRFIEVDDTFAYLLGRFVGDGCTFQNNNHPAFNVDAFNVAYNTSTEMSAAHKMVEIFYRVFNIAPNIITSQNNTTYIRKASLIVATVLNALVGSGFDTKRIPQIIWESNSRIQRQFLLGLYDADGFVTTQGSVHVELTNPSLLSEIQTMMTTLGIPCTHTGKRLSSGATFTQMFRHQLSKVYDDDRLNFRCTKIPTTGPKPLDGEGFIITPERIDENYSGFVYNISVEDDESYTVNNVVVHNCYVGPRGGYDIDSLDGILTSLRNQAQTLKSEGGWGENFSYIRPRGSFIHGIGVETPGAIKYMEMFDKSSEIITSGSGKKSTNKQAKGKIRKGAMMGVMDVWHPDILEFVTAKQQPGRLTKFNISVNCTDEFMNRVLIITELEAELAEAKTRGQEVTERLVQAEIDLLDKWDLVFPVTTFEKYKAEWNGDINLWRMKGYPVNVVNTTSVKSLWNLIMESTYNRAEPGVLFLDRANKFGPLNYAETIFATNPCGEQTLAPGNVCNLGSLNLVHFLNKDRTGLDLKKIKKYTQYLVRFLDNVSDLSQAPLPEYEWSMKNKRRIGVGILGWGSALYTLKIKFGSGEAALLREDLMRTIAQTAYSYSVDLAEEKGMFSVCQPEKHVEGDFVRSLSLPQVVIDKMKKVGIRNSSLLSIQPTGNTSIFANVVSGGLEPVFMHEYVRTVIVNSMPDHISAVTPKWYEGEWYETDMFKLSQEGDEEILRGVDLAGVVYKIDRNRGLTKEVLCEDFGVRFMKRAGEWDPQATWAATTTNMTVQDHVSDLTGFARWVDSAMSKTINVPNDYPFANFSNIYLDAYKSGYVKGVTTYRSGTMTTVLAAKDEKDAAPHDEEIILDDVKLPDSSPASVKVLRAEGKKWYVTSIWNEQQTRPFALFVHTNSHEKSVTTSDAVERLTDLARNKGIPERHIEATLIKISSDNNASKITRMISLSLRHGVLIKNIVRALDRVEDVYVGTFLFQIRKFLASFIKDGEAVEGQTCETCGSSRVVYSEGCSKCLDCSSSKCG